MKNYIERIIKPVVFAAKDQLQKDGKQTGTKIVELDGDIFQVFVKKADLIFVRNEHDSKRKIYRIKTS